MTKSITATCLLAGLMAGGTAAGFQKHSAPAPAPAKPAAAPARPAVSSGGAAKSSGTGAAAGGAKTGAAAGPTTGHPAGPTTGNPVGHGPTTASPAPKGPTTSNPAGRGPTTATPAAARGPAVPAARGPAAPAPGRASASTAPRTPVGNKVAHTPDGKDVRTRADGKPAEVHDPKRGMDIHHSLTGSRSVRVERADHSRVVAERGGRGYVQKPYTFRGHEFGHRTYYSHGRAYDRFYRRYEYRGVFLDVYAPAYYYPVAFYGWAYNPWFTPVPYAWGFAANPWYGYYNGYFTPYPVYSNASMWLTDYMVSNELAAAYEDRAAGQARGPAAPAPGQVALTPEVKQQISAEVQRQLALENSEAGATAQNRDVDPQSSSVARMLTDGASHVFVVGRALDLVDSNGMECPVTPGDVLQLTAPPPPNAASANLVVLAGKGGSECGKGKVVTVAVNDMQDMQNHMRETIDQGLGDLQSKQGKGGLPAAPESAKAAAAKAPFAAEAPPPDPGAAAEIAKQSQEADAAEKEIAPAAPAGGPSATGGNAPPPEVAVGQTVSQVESILGKPKSIANLGPKQIYVYSDMKVTFTSGKVSGIQ